MDNLIVIGESVPDELKDKRKMMCTACYSEEYGLIRIYPVPPRAQMRRWDKVSIPLERNPQDTRTESWKIESSRLEWNALSEKIRYHGRLERQEWVRLVHTLYDRYGVDCIEDLNDNRSSLGIVKPYILRAWMEERGDKYDPTIQFTLDSDDPFYTIRNYTLQPRMKYRCHDCHAQNPHNQQILEWGVYEWIRKHPHQAEKFVTNLRLFDRQYDKYFLVGNNFKYRNSFMVISVFRFKRT